MAYRFMLETPEVLAEQANMAVSAVDGAQVVVSRASLEHGFDLPYTNHTIAAQNLRVIDALYDWYEAIPTPKPDLRIVLHSGERVNMSEVSRGDAIAAIRRDQPWVERTIPRIGDHAATTFAPDWQDDQKGDTRMAAGSLATVTESLPVQQGLEILEVNYVAIQVTDLRKAEEFYQDFFGMEIVARTRANAAGEYTPVAASYTWDVAIVTETAADTAFLRNGALTLALHRVGLGGRIDRTVLDRISLQIDQASFDVLRGWILMRSFEILGTNDDVFLFRDPFGVVWEIRRQNALASR